MRGCRACVAISIALCFSEAFAWGADAHRLIAELAERQLTPEAKLEASRLLDHEPGATIVSVSTWADQSRRPASAALHYVNIADAGCIYTRELDCKDDRCVVEAIAEQVGILKSTAPDRVRLIALKYIIHFVGDIHQPLHAGSASDKGGNQFQVRAFGRGTNLHAVWDSELLRQRPGGHSRLLQDASTPIRPQAHPAEPSRWAAESCAIHRDPQFYPSRRTVDAGYATHWDGILVSRLALAGERLAQTLNEALRQPSR